jgi:hypothetical protein
MCAVPVTSFKYPTSDQLDSVRCRGVAKVLLHPGNGAPDDVAESIQPI